jgi:hypothetical protein
LSANNRETTLQQSAPVATTRHVDVEPSRGARHDVDYVGGLPEPEERHGLPAEFLMIARGWKPGTEGFKYGFRTQDLLRMLSRSLYLTNSSLNRYPTIDKTTSSGVAMVIATAHMSTMRPHGIVYHGGSGGFNAIVL